MRNLFLLLVLICRVANADTQLCLRYEDKLSCTTYEDTGQIVRQDQQDYNLYPYQEHSDEQVR